MAAPVQSRRARLRAEANAEIKAIALELMAAGGPDAITLRAIARQMGMTPNALYGYFATRDDLVGALIADVHTSLAETLEAARDAEPADDPARRLLAWAEAYRSWALANPGAFRLIYGESGLDCRAADGGPVVDAEHRACVGLIGLATANWPDVEALPGADAAAGRTSIPASPPRRGSTSPACSPWPSPGRFACGAACTAWCPSRSTDTWRIRCATLPGSTSRRCRTCSARSGRSGTSSPSACLVG